MAWIRPQEALLFNTYKTLVKSPILDFGCGDGFFASMVFGENKINIGLDMQNNKRVEIARKNNIYKKILTYDGKIIPLPSSSVKTIISNCVFEHIDNISLSLSEMYRILKPGGYCLTTIMTSQWEKHLLGTNIFGAGYKRFMRKRQEHRSFFSHHKWVELCKQHKFTVIDTIGYMTPQNTLWIDAMHYFSIPSLVTYRLFGRWNLLSSISNFGFLNDLIQKITKKPLLPGQKYAAFLFILKK